MPTLFTAVLLSSMLLIAGASSAAESSKPGPVTLRLLSSGGIIGAIQAIAPEYQTSTGVKLEVALAPSWGHAPEAIPARLDHDEPADVVLMVGSGMDRLVARHQVDKSSRVDLGKAFIAVAVREGADKPDISTIAAFRKTLLNADSVAYSDGVSGVYLSRWLFAHMKLDQRFKRNAKMTSSEPVGAVVARGDAQLGVEQLSELKRVRGIDIVGLIPDQVQQMKLYSGAVVNGSAHPLQAKALLDYMRSARGRQAIEHSGLTPVD